MEGHLDVERDLVGGEKQLELRVRRERHRVEEIVGERTGGRKKRARGGKRG